MDIFSFFVKLTHPRTRRGWAETDAYFTGRCQIPRKVRAGHSPWMQVSAVPVCHEYEIRYFDEAGERTGWYLFYPAPDPDPDIIRGKTVRIRYRKSRPWIFEKVPVEES